MLRPGYCRRRVVMLGFVYPRAEMHSRLKLTARC